MYLAEEEQEALYSLLPGSGLMTPKALTLFISQSNHAV